MLWWNRRIWRIQPSRTDDQRWATSFANLPYPTPFRAADLGAKPAEEPRINKFICRRSAATGALSVKRPAKNKLPRTIIFSSHPSEPMVDQRGLADASPGNDCQDI